MGCMGVYAGLIYNDYFSLGLDLFGSNYQFLTEESGSKVRVFSFSFLIFKSFDTAAFQLIWCIEGL